MSQETSFDVLDSLSSEAKLEVQLRGAGLTNKEISSMTSRSKLDRDINALLASHESGDAAGVERAIDTIRVALGSRIAVGEVVTVQFANGDTTEKLLGPWMNG